MDKSAFGHKVQWQAFRDKVDELWRAEMAEEMRVRLAVLPDKLIPFPSPVTHDEIIVEENIDVPMRDGIVLRVDIYRPETPGCYPVTINRGPYDKTSSLDLTPAVARNLARRGYVCICQDVRGRYASEGEYEPLVSEVEDGVDTVEWAASQSWSNGKVGMFGISYNGFTSLAAAAGQAPHLRCVYPGMIGYGFRPRRGGVPMLQGAGGWYIWAGQGRELHNPLRADSEHLPLHEIDDKAGLPTPFFDALVTNDLAVTLPGEFSQAHVERQLGRIGTPLHMTAGWYDEITEDTLEAWCRVAAHNPDARLLIGPWHHNLCDMEQARIGRIPTAEPEIRRYFENMDLFFAWHLKGEGNALSQAQAQVRLFVMGRNVWRDEDRWPLARSQTREMYLDSSGGAGNSPSDGRLDWQLPSRPMTDEYDYDPLDPVRSPADVWTYLDNMGDRTAIEARRDVLVYTTPALETELEVTGSIGVVLFAASDCPDTDFVATLVDVHPDGHTQYLTHGIVRARYRNGADRPELIKPGHVYRYAFSMRPICNVFLPGHRLRLEVTSSEFSRYSRNQNVAAPPGLSDEVRTAHQVLHLGGAQASCLVLPVIPNDAG